MVVVERLGSDQILYMLEGKPREFACWIGCGSEKQKSEGFYLVQLEE